jgi:hypothetical protein
MTIGQCDTSCVHMRRSSVPLPQQTLCHYFPTYVARDRRRTAANRGVDYSHCDALAVRRCLCDAWHTDGERSLAIGGDRQGMRADKGTPATH